MSLRTIQTILDENKEQLPDGLYKKLCDATKQEYDTEKKKEKNLYELKVLIPTFYLDCSTRENTIRIIPRGMTIISPLPQYAVDGIEREIKERGFSWGLGIDKREITLTLPTKWITDTYEEFDDPVIELPEITNINMESPSIICSIKKYEE